MVALPPCSPLPVGAEGRVSLVSQSEKKKKKKTSFFDWVLGLFIYAQRVGTQFLPVLSHFSPPQPYIFSLCRSPGSVSRHSSWEAEHLHIKNLTISFIDWKKDALDHCWLMEWQVGNNPLEVVSRDSIPFPSSFVGSLWLMTTQATLTDQQFGLELGWGMDVFSLYWNS